MVGAIEVHRRMDFLVELSDEFFVAAAGSERSVHERFREAGLAYHHYPLSRGFSPAGDLVSTLRLARLIRRLKPDIVHTFGTKPSLWGRFAARLAGTPVVVGTLPGLGSLYSHRDTRTRLLRATYNLLQRVCCRVSDLTIFQNSDDARELQSAGIVPPQKAAIVPGSGIRTQLFDPSSVPGATTERIRSQLGAGQDAVIVTMVSRLIRSKGVLEFARAAAILGPEHPSTVFVLVGPDDRESVERLTPEELAEVKDSVRWLGERRDVREILAASDVAVLPSFYREGIPRALLEAAAMGLPLVSTRAPGCSEIVEDGRNGILVQPRDPTSLAAAIGRLLADPALRRRFGEASRTLCVERFDLSVVVARTARLYWELLSRPGGQDRQSRARLRRPGERFSGSGAVASR